MADDLPDPPPDTALRLRIVEDIATLDAAAWDALAGDDNPFVSHAFLSALEDSGSTTDRTGWLPHHAVLEDPAGRLRAAAPMYLKGHSYGEYVFDHGWANAFERAGGDYYPKLQVSVPFTPATGPRLLVRADDPQRAAVAESLAAGIAQVAEQNALSSAHVTFPRAADGVALQAAGWLRRIGVQFHWHNHGYGDFDAFLGTLNARKRKAIKKERRQVAECGVELVTLSGGDLTPAVWDAFYRFYQNTIDRKWGWAYLTRAFFDLLGQRMGDRVVLVMGRSAGEWVCGALNLRGTDALYGRNWGCDARVKFLHFEACYYRAIDFAIAHGLARVEAGAQGPHKIQRGYVPVETESYHWINHDGFRRGVAQFLDQETQHIRAEIAALAAESPYRSSENLPQSRMRSD